MLARVKRPKIPVDQFKGLITKESQKDFWKKERKNKVLIYIYFKIKELILILILNLEICI